MSRYLRLKFGKVSIGEAEVESRVEKNWRCPESFGEWKDFQRVRSVCEEALVSTLIYGCETQVMDQDTQK